jgi:acyl carrier protein
MSMSDQGWPASFEGLLRDHLPLAGPQPLQPDDRLADLGLDSLGTVAVLLDLEDGFAVAVPDDLLVAETFRSVGSLWAVIGRLQDGT